MGGEIFISIQLNKLSMPSFVISEGIFTFDSTGSN
jgi:hypothetical protein